MRKAFLAGVCALALSACSLIQGTGEVSEDQRTFNSLAAACGAGSGAVRTLSLQLSTQGMDTAQVATISDSIQVSNAVLGGPVPLDASAVSTSLLLIQAEIYRLTIMEDAAQSDARIDPVTVIITATELAKWLLDLREQAQAGEMTVEQKQAAWDRCNQNWASALDLWETAKLNRTLQSVMPETVVEGL